MPIKTIICFGTATWLIVSGLNDHQKSDLVGHSTSTVTWYDNGSLVSVEADTTRHPDTHCSNGETIEAAQSLSPTIVSQIIRRMLSQSNTTLEGHVKVAFFGNTSVTVPLEENQLPDYGENTNQQVESCTQISLSTSIGKNNGTVTVVDADYNWRTQPSLIYEETKDTVQIIFNKTVPEFVANTSTEEFVYNASFGITSVVTTTEEIQHLNSRNKAKVQMKPSIVIVIIICIIILIAGIIISYIKIFKRQVVSVMIRPEYGTWV